MVHPDDLVGQSNLFERPQDTQIASVAARSFVHSSKAVELEHARSLLRSRAPAATETCASSRRRRIFARSPGRADWISEDDADARQDGLEAGNQPFSTARRAATCRTLS